MVTDVHSLKLMPQMVRTCVHTYGHYQFITQCYLCNTANLIRFHHN